MISDKFAAKHYNILITATILFGLIILFGIIIEIIIVYPAYWSYKGDTNQTLNLDRLSEGKIGGIAYPNGSIVLFENSTIYLRHEICHRSYFLEKKKMNMFIEEMICYTKQWFIWNKVNLTSLDWQDG